MDVTHVVAEKRQYQLLYFVLFASSNGIFAFRNVYFKELGLSGFQMGVVGAVVVVAGVLAQPVWGIAADRFGRTKLAMAAGAIGSAFAALLYTLASGVAWPFALVLVASVVFSVFRSPIDPLANAMVLSAGLDYGRVRAFGSVAFGVGILLVGAGVERFGTPLIFYVYVVGMVGFLATLVGLPRPEADVTPDIGRKSLSLLRNPTYVLLVGVAMLVGGTTATGGAFFSVYMRAVGAGDGMTGAAWLVRTLAEAAVFVGIGSLGLRSRHQLPASALAYIVTFVGYGLFGGLVVLFGLQVVHGVAIALFGLSSVELAHRLAPSSLASTSQAMVGALGIGLGNAIGQVVGGRLVDLVGVQALYLYLAAALVVAFLVSLAFVHPRFGE